MFRFDRFDYAAPRLQLNPSIMTGYRFVDLLVTLLVLLFVLTLFTSPARSQAPSTIFLTDRNGQIAFPFVPPNRATNGPAKIDNTDIGTVVPKAGVFTTLQANSITSSDGVTCAYYNQVLTAAIGDSVIFIANRAYQVVSAREIHAVAAGGASVVQITKDTGTQAPGAGVDLLTNNTNTGFDLNATANTVQTATLSATPANLLLAAGDRLSVDFSAAIQSSSGIAITVCLAPK